MNFQEFCDKEQEVDEQLVSINNTFVISFGKPEGTSFNIDPNDIRLFLLHMRDNHDICIATIESDPRFTANSYTKYQEKPYRALYKLIEGDVNLNTIRSLGGSQTKELTKIISKLVCYLAGSTYTRIQENTHFDKPTIELALANMPADLRSLIGGSNISTSFDRSGSRVLFENWLKNKGLSEKSIKNYAGSTIKLVDTIIYGKGALQSVYSISSAEGLERVIAQLKDNAVWQQKNRDGKEMWKTGLNHYYNFLKEHKCSLSLTKPFLLLAGISGTGKTRFVREQARVTDAGLNNFCLVPVRPDWHEPSDLLGYVTRLSGTAQYVPTEVIKFIVRAWQVVAPNISGESCGELNNAAVPYWLCLDEMNLAPVEQYFSDYLSVLESRKFDNGQYECDSLINKDMFQLLSATDSDFRSNLGVENDGLWDFFLANGISLPPNLIVAGTVNMDETTHGFSRKVIDRAVTLDFGEFFPNNYSEFFNQSTSPVTFSWPMLTHATVTTLGGSVDGDGLKSIAFLEGVNSILKKTPFELAYRALNELLLQVSCFQPASNEELQAVWDDFLMTKVLPRIDGDDDKLRSVVASGQGTVLEDLDHFLSDKLDLIWGDDLNRKDYFRVQADDGGTVKINCRSKAKLQWMRDRLEANTFTSFWP
jgi:hypothetical protein